MNVVQCRLVPVCIEPTEKPASIGPIDGKVPHDVDDSLCRLEPCGVGEDSSIYELCVFRGCDLWSLLGDKEECRWFSLHTCFVFGVVNRLEHDPDDARLW